MSCEKNLLMVLSCALPFLAGYILEVDPDKRPDIFQVSHAAFQIAGKDNPVQNLNVSELHCHRRSSLMYHSNKFILKTNDFKIATCHFLARRPALLG